MATSKSSKSRGGLGSDAGMAKKPPRLTIRMDHGQKTTLKVEQEDSGVHLDEVPVSGQPGEQDSESVPVSRRPSSRTPTSAPAELFHHITGPMSLHSPTSTVPSKTVKSASDYQISRELQEKCTVLGSTKPLLRASKSESPQPVNSSSSFPNCVQVKRPATRLSSTASTCSTTTSSPPETPDSKVQFDFGSDSEEESSSVSAHKGATKKIPPLNRESKGKGRFKRILRPLRRSQSAGCSQDVPAHALFLRHETDRKPLPPQRKSLDRSVSSTDRVNSDSDGDDSEKKATGKAKKKSLAKDLKEKMAFLRRRHTDTALASKMADPKSQRPTPESIASWNQSFDNLLLDKHGLELFREFLRTEFSEENIEFWIACEEYKGIKGNKLAPEAQRIYSDFVAVQAPREINLDSKTRLACHNNMSNPNRQTFEQAQKRIQALMEKDSYPRFLKADVYQDLCAEHKLNT